MHDRPQTPDAPGKRGGRDGRGIPSHTVGPARFKFVERYMTLDHPQTAEATNLEKVAGPVCAYKL